MSRKLLVLGAGRGQTGLIVAGKRLGYTVGVASMATGAPPGISMADFWLEADISRPESVLQACDGYRFDGVCTACMDTPLDALAAVAEAQNLVGLSTQAAEACSDKVLLKQLLESGGVAVAASAVVEPSTSIAHLQATMQLPLVVKVPTLQGSAGIFICDTWDQVQDALGEIRATYSATQILVEQFLKGTEFGAQALVLNGQVLDVRCHGDRTIRRKTAIPVGHYLPCPLPTHVQETARVQVERAVKALGLDNCVVNADLMASDEQVYVIEITGRAGANCLPELMSAYYGFDYYEMIVRLAMNDEAERLWKSRSPNSSCLYAAMLFSETQEGIVSSIKEASAVSNVRYKKLFISGGSEMRAFETSNDCIGEVLIEGTTIDDCLTTLDLYRKQLKIEIAR